MIMSIMGFDKKIEFDENIVNIVEIYDQKLFTEIIDNLNNQFNGEQENNEIVFMEDDARMNMQKVIYVLTDVFNIDFNSKKILNKIYNILAQNIKNKQDDELEEITLKLRNYFIKEINELPFEFNMNRDVEIIDLIKAYDVKIDTSCYITVLDKIEFIINLLSEFDLANLLIVPNLKTFLQEDDLLELYKYSMYNNIKLLVLENKHYENVLKYEKKNIIDENFNEI